MHSQEWQIFGLPKRGILMNAFSKAQFNYCPVIWVFHSRSFNKIY